MKECPSCLAPSEVEDRFCHKCGAALDPSPPSAGLASSTRTQQAISLGEIRFKLGLVHYRKGERAQARDLWTKVLEENPNHREAREMLEKLRVGERS